MKEAINLGVSWKEGNDNIGITTSTNGGKFIYYGISYCPFCGKKLVQEESECIHEWEFRDPENIGHEMAFCKKCGYLRDSKGIISKETSELIGLGRGHDQEISTEHLKKIMTENVSNEDFMIAVLKYDPDSKESIMDQLNRKLKERKP